MPDLQKQETFFQFFIFILLQSDLSSIAPGCLVLDEQTKPCFKLSWEIIDSLIFEGKF